MKRISAFILAFILSFSFLALPITAQGVSAERHEYISILRAGGGGSGGGGSGGGSSGGGGGGGGGSSSSHHHTTNSGGESNPLSAATGFAVFILLASSATVIFRFKLSRRARNTKKLMKLLVQKDSAWKYKNIQKTVRTAYFIIQKAWTASDMLPAKAYMSKELYESFETKLSWMAYQNKRNVLKRIKLKEAVPVAVHDNEDNSLDFVWFYIKGRMIDYHVNTETGDIIDGSTLPSSFGEYWQFTRTETNEWVLNSILQENEADQIPFND